VYFFSCILPENNIAKAMKDPNLPLNERKKKNMAERYDIFNPASGKRR